MTTVSIRVLVADDSESMRILLKEVLENKGCEVTVVGDGEAALQAMKVGYYNIVITDYHMPGLDGIEFLTNYLEGLPRLAYGFGTTLVVILSGVTGGGDDEQKLRAFVKTHIIPVLPKPIDMKVIEQIPVFYQQMMYNMTRFLG